MRFITAGALAALGVWLGWLLLAALSQPSGGAFAPDLAPPAEPAPASAAPAPALSTEEPVAPPDALRLTPAAAPLAPTPSPPPTPTVDPVQAAPAFADLAVAILDFIDARRIAVGQPTWDRDVHLDSLAGRQALRLAEHFQAAGNLSLPGETLGAAFAGSPFICSDHALAMPRWERVAYRDGVIERREGDRLALPLSELAERVARDWLGDLANPVEPIPEYYAYHGVGLRYDGAAERLFVAYVYCAQVDPALQPGAPDTPAALWLADGALLEQATHAALNAYRGSHGLALLGYEPAIAEAARAHSQRMSEVFDQRGLVHSSELEGDAFTGTPYLCGENILMGPRSTSHTTLSGAVVARKDDLLQMALEDLGRELAQRWIDSPPHERNLRGEHYTLSGVGVYYDQAKERLFATHNLCYSR